MARTPQPDITSRDITGLKYFHQLAPLLERLHDVECQRDRAGNRELHYDQCCMLILLYMFRQSDRLSLGRGGSPRREPLDAAHCPSPTTRSVQSLIDFVGDVARTAVREHDS